MKFSNYTNLIHKHLQKTGTKSSYQTLFPRGRFRGEVLLILVSFTSLAFLITTCNAIASQVSLSSRPTNAPYARLNLNDLNVPFIMTIAWERGTSNVEYFRPRSVRFVLNSNNQTVDVIDNDLAGLGTLFHLPVLKKDTTGYQVDLATGINQVYYQPPLYLSNEATANPALFKLAIIPIPPNVQKMLSQNSKNIALDLALDKSFYSATVPTIGAKESCTNITPDYCLVVQTEVDLNVPTATTLHMRFSPQESSKNFVKKLDTQGNGIGYYATFPDSNNQSFIARRDTSEGLTWYTDVPDEMYSVVQEAASYWNDVFGKQLIRVKHRPAALDIWQPYILSVEFFPNDPSGTAAGIFSVGPDGKMVTGHIYVPNGFVGYANSSFAYYENALKKEGWSDKKIAQAGKRYVHDFEVQTFAHEIGHSLGLRHNFKGSTQSTIKDLAVSLWNYIKSDTIEPEESPSSTLMDYMGIDFFALIGAKIRRAHEGNTTKPQLKYDQYAINWGYNSKSMSVNAVEAGPYCDLPQVLSQSPYQAPDDPSCASWDDPPGTKVIRVDLGTQKTILFGSKEQIFAQCQLAFDVVLLQKDKPQEISLSPTGNYFQIRKTNNSAYLSISDVCGAIHGFLQSM